MIQRLSFVAFVALALTVGYTSAESVRNSLKAYVQNKVKGGNPVADIVCDGLGTNPKSPTCFSESGKAKCGNPDQCPSPCKCWLARPAKLDADNRIQTWSATNPSFDEIKKQLSKWKVPREMYDNFEMATMSDSGKFAKFHFYVQPDKSKAKFELALGTARKKNSVVEIGYIYVKASAELAPVFYKCGQKKVKGGFLGLKKKTKRWCHSTGISSDRIEKTRQALQFFAFESIRFHSGGSEQEAISCKRVFNCRCYLARYPDLQKAFNGNCDKARQHYACPGATRGRRRLTERGPFVENDMSEEGLWDDIAEETELPRSLFGRRIESSRRVLKSGQKPAPVTCGFGKKENRNPSCCDDNSINRDELDDIDFNFKDVQQGIRNVQVSSEVAPFSDDEDEEEIVFELNQREVNDIADKVLSDVYGVNLGMRMIRPSHTLFQSDGTFQYDTAEESNAYVNSEYEPGE